MNAVDRMIGNVLEYEAEVRVKVVPVEFGTAQQAVNRRRSLPAGIAPSE